VKPPLRVPSDPVVTRGNENCEHATRACSQFLRARVRSIGEAALLALPFQVFGGYMTPGGLEAPYLGARASLPDVSCRYGARRYLPGRGGGNRRGPVDLGVGAGVCRRGRGF